jgi:hypothetical protein
LIATPSSNFQFYRWSGDTGGKSRTTSTIAIIMDSNKYIVANFTPIQYSLSTSVNPPEGGSINPSSGTFSSGTQITITATPSSYWEFDHWSGADNNHVNPTTVNMTNHKNVTAFFVAQDTDGDGLTDEEERRVFTNPYYVDTDDDGLSDYEEVEVKKTDPRNPDTDGDGVNDGNDLFPFNDAYVKVTIKYFEDTSAPGEEPDVGGNLGDPYFKVWADSVLKISKKPIAYGVSSRSNPYSATFNIPDDNQFVLIKVEVWDYDGGWGTDDQYDTGSLPGNTSEYWIYEKQFDILGGTITETSDGAVDGHLNGPQAKIIVEIATTWRQVPK